MKRLLFVLSAVLAFASCQKEEMKSNENAVNEILYANILDTKTSLNGLKTYWSDGDEIKVYDSNGNSVDYKYVSGNQFEQVPGSMSGSFSINNFAAAYYPAEKANGYNTGTKVLSVSVPATQSYAEGSFGANAAPMASNVINTVGNVNTIVFKNAFAVVEIPVKYIADHDNFAPAVDYVSLTSATTKLNGNFTLTFSGENMVSVGAGDGDNTVKLEGCSTAGSMGSTAKSFFIVVPGMQDNEKIYVYVNNGVTKRAVTTANRTSDDKNPLKQNTILKMPELTIFDDGTVNGKFSVSSTQQVYFSQGNLQYRANSVDWRFAPSQWSVIGSNNTTRSLGASNTNYIDLFAYGSSGVDPNIMPYSDATYTAGSINGTNYDWGVYNAISNGGNVAGLWRTLTLDEWDYLFNRTHGFACATVNGIAGIIVFPDRYSETAGITFPTKTTDSTKPGEWSGNNANNVLNGDSWLKLESGGCVFIPDAGLKVTSGVKYTNTFNSNYWTSTKADCTWPSGTHKGNIPRYFYMVNDVWGSYFRTGESNGNGTYAYAVRLARNI